MKICIITDGVPWNFDEVTEIIIDAESGYNMKKDQDLNAWTITENKEHTDETIG